MLSTDRLQDYPDLGERISEIVRDRIVNGRLLPGSALLAAEIARELGVSRTPVTDALNRLAGEGLVEVIPRRGYVVARLDGERFADLLEARMMIEMVAAERGMGLVSAADVEALGRLITEMEECLDASGCYRDYDRFVAADAEFHRRIVLAARNHHLCTLYDRLCSHFHIARMAHAATRQHRPTVTSLRAHRRIQQAFAARDGRAAKEAIQDHIQAVLQGLLATQVEQPAKPPTVVELEAGHAEHPADDGPDA